MTARLDAGGFNAMQDDKMLATENARGIHCHSGGRTKIRPMASARRTLRPWGAQQVIGECVWSLENDTLLACKVYVAWLDRGLLGLQLERSQRLRCLRTIRLHANVIRAAAEGSKADGCQLAVCRRKGSACGGETGLAVPGCCWLRGATLTLHRSACTAPNIVNFWNEGNVDLTPSLRHAFSHTARNTLTRVCFCFARCELHPAPQPQPPHQHPRAGIGTGTGRLRSS
jgi:hypothetical protein